MKNTIKTIIISLLILVTFSSLIFTINSTLYKTLVQEDGIIEYASAITHLVLSIFVIMRLMRFKNTKSLGWIVFNIFLAFGFFIAFGEEISWGQRIFNIQSTEFFLENNVQNEINFHNLEVYGLKVNIIIFTYLIGLVFGCYLFGSTLLYKKNRTFRNTITKVGIPLPKLIHSMIFILGTLIVLAVPNSRKWEAWECFNVLLVFLIFIDPFNPDERLIK